jgi:hypothetical protein
MYFPKQYTVTPSAGQEINLLSFDVHNTDASGISGHSSLNAIFVSTEADSIDCAAAIKLVNKGRGDTIYVGIQGKVGTTPSSPTGIGIDMNRTSVSGNGENSSVMLGLAIQIWDWSETNIGIGGPRCYYGRKVNNYDTDHCLVFLESNRRHIELSVPGTVAAGGSGAIPTVGGTFVPTQPVIEVLLQNTSGGFAAGARFQLLAAGHVVLGTGAQFLFNPVTGNQSGLFHGGDDVFYARLGSSGLGFQRNSDGATIASLSNAGNLTLTGNTTVDGLEVSHAKPTASQVIQANGCAYIFGQPYVIPAGVVITINAGAILRIGL